MMPAMEPEEPSQAFAAWEGKLETSLKSLLMRIGGEGDE